MKIGKTRIRVVRGSMLEQNTDVIVNAAKTSLRGGGGIDGMIHNAAGGQLDLYELKYFPNGTETGQAVITPAFNLPHKAIIHVPGPMWTGGISNESFLLTSSYCSSIALANSFKFESIAFCSISTGIYSYPLAPAADIAVKTIAEWCDWHCQDGTIKSVVFAMYGEEEFNAFLKALRKVKREVYSKNA